MNKRTALALALAILTMAASVYSAFTAVTNTYQKPIREAEKIANADPEDYDYEAVMGQSYGGLGKSELVTIAKVIQASPTFDDSMSTTQSHFATMVESRKAQYGDGSVVEYDVQSKEDLPIAELKKAKDSLTEQGEHLIALGEFFDTLSDEQVTKITKAMDITEDDFTKLIGAVKRLGKQITGVQVSAGYRLQLTRTITDADGAVLDSADLNVTVLNINGQWLAYDYENNGGFMLDEDFDVSSPEIEQLLEPLQNL